MKLKVKDLDIATGGPLIAVLNKEDARKLDLRPDDRIRIKIRNRETIAAVDIAESGKVVKVGKIGLFEEVLTKIGAKDKDYVSIQPEKKPESIKYIRKKLDGIELKKEEIKEIIQDLMENNITEIELAYFISGCYSRGLSLNETIALTKAMVESGDTLKWRTMIVVPIVAAGGLVIPKTSSRAITSASGTADTMEVLCNVSLSLDEIRNTVKKTNGCIVWGGAVRLAPADDKIIKVENPLSIDAEGNMLSSIMAKKAAVGSTHLLIDIPIGFGAKIQSMNKALKLKKEFIDLSEKIGIKTQVLFTDGSQPVGNGIGPILEARDVMWVLKNDERGPNDLKERAIMLAENLLCMAKKDKNLARRILESGLAYQKMIEIIEEQGRRIRDINDLKPGRFRYDFLSLRNMRVKQIDNRLITKIARLAGAPQDKGAGIYLYVHKGQDIKRGDNIFTIFAENKQKIEFAIEYLEHNKGEIIK